MFAPLIDKEINKQNKLSRMRKRQFGLIATEASLVEVHAMDFVSEDF